MSLDGMARAARPHRGAALQDPARDRRPEPVATGRRTDERRRLLAGTALAKARRFTTASLPRGATRTCASFAAHVEAPLFLVHVRAAIGSPIQQTNCHPFRHGRWLFVHNGYVGDFHVIRRDLMWAIDPELFAGIVGSTDTEVVFRLALTFGLEEDPIRALERTVRMIETTATERGVAPMVQGTFGVSDGQQPVGRAVRD